MPFNPNSFLLKSTCPSCGAALEWGVTTSVVKKVEKCNNCKAVLGKD